EIANCALLSGTCYCIVNIPKKKERSPWWQPLPVLLNQISICYSSVDGASSGTPAMLYAMIIGFFSSPIKLTNSRLPYLTAASRQIASPGLIPSFLPSTTEALAGTTNLHVLQSRTETNSV